MSFDWSDCSDWWTDMERQMMPTEDGVAPPWNGTNPSPATPGVLAACCYAILHHLANLLLEYSASLSRPLHTCGASRLGHGCLGSILLMACVSLILDQGKTAWNEARHGRGTSAYVIKKCPHNNYHTKNNRFVCKMGPFCTV